MLSDKMNPGTLRCSGFCVSGARRRSGHLLRSLRFFLRD
nr:MAG TPA: hypothetical protein [Caudoviricetes sp.]